MLRNLVLVTGAAAMLASAQSYPFRASVRGGGGPEGKCTIEVVVDGAAEVEVRGDQAVLRNLWGQTPQWRRFECNGVMPDRPADFRFKGIDGRGRQELTRDPRNGGPAVVRIEDPPGGSEGYTFDLIWRTGGAFAPEPPHDAPFVSGDRGDRDDRGDHDRRRFSAEQAVQVCRDEVRRQAEERFRTPDINFRRVNMDDGPGRNDWVVGTFDVHGRPGREDVFQFSCSVDFDSGRVRSANIDAWDGRR